MGFRLWRNSHLFFTMEYLLGRLDQSQEGAEASTQNGHLSHVNSPLWRNSELLLHNGVFARDATQLVTRSTRTFNEQLWVTWAHWIAAGQMWNSAIQQDNASIHLIVDTESTIPLSFMWSFSGYRKQRLILPAFRIHERNTEILIVVTTWISFDFTNSLNWFLLTYV